MQPHLHFTKPSHKLAALTIVALMIQLFLFVSPVQAATITVDAACNLSDAITSANTDTATGGCLAGSGADTIVLTQDVSLSAALPPVVSTVILEGGGFTINGNGGAFTVLEVGPTAALTLTQATVTGGGRGGLRSSGTLTILDSTITANTKTGNGGGIENGGVLNLVRTTVNGNSASVYGGGIYHQSASPALLVNVTLSGNHGGVAGGAIAIQNPTGTFTTTTVTVYNSTIVTNTAPLSGGGIFSYALGGKIYINLYQNILSGNRANNSIGNEFRQANGSGGSHEIVRAYNILGDAGETANQAFVNPLFPGPTDRNATSSGTPAAFNTIVVPLLNNNGIHPHPDTHALPVGSPAIDFAPSAVCLASPVSNFDARTGFRNINGVGGDTANECDSGAYEFGATPNPTAVELSGLRASPTKTILPIALALALLLASLVSLAFWRKNRQV